MKKLILLLLVAYCGTTMAASKGTGSERVSKAEPIIEVTGMLADMKGDFIKLQPKNSKEPVWVHKSMLVGSVISNKQLQAVMTPSDIYRYQDELAKLQSTSSKK